MSRAVLLTDGAARDLDELYAAAYDRGGADGADRFLDRIQVLLTRLADEGSAGRRLPQLRRLGLDDGRVLRDGDLRIVYRLRQAEARLGEADALLVLIANAGRSMQSLLQRRMLED